MTGRDILEARQRPLKDSEVRLLRSRSASLRNRGRRAVSAGAWIGAVAIALLWAMTMLASDAPPLVVTGFWLVIGGLIFAWVWKDLRGDSRTMDSVAAGLESAVRRNLADVFDIHASAFIEFEEIEDEGACYAFQIGDNRLVFLQGQEFYEEARFPSLDFSLVFPLDEAGRSVDMLIDKRATKAAPQRRVPASVKRRLQIPDSLAVLAGTLDGLEDQLRG